MKYSDNDLLNIIALCEQEPKGLLVNNLRRRCIRALAYIDVQIRVTKAERDFLEKLYDEDMDSDAKKTIDYILNRKGEKAR